MKKRSTAAILAMFLGGLGVHKFYLRQPGKGILYIFFTFIFFPITSILSIIDFIIYLCMDKDEFDAKYNR